MNNYINLQPSKCAFLVTNSVNFDQLPIIINNQEIPYCDSQLYLGSFICASGNINDHVKGDLKNRMKSVIKYYAFLRRNTFLPLSYKLKVLESCIVSSLIYNSETWGNANIDKLEIIYRKMLKTTLGIKISTCNELPYIELNVPTIKSKIYKKQLKFWHSIQELENDDPVKIACQAAQQSQLEFIKHYQNLDTKYTINNITELSIDEIRNSIRLKASQNKTKYVTYLKINPSLEKSNIYTSYTPWSKLQYMIKLRTISHDLIDEIGRRKNIPKELRICHCQKSTETEEHFLLYCESYNDIRFKYGIANIELKNILNENFLDYTNELVARRKYLSQNAT